MSRFKDSQPAARAAANKTPLRLPATGLVLGFLLLETCYLQVAQLGNLRQHAGIFLAYFGLAFLAYLSLAAWVHRVSSRTMQANRRLLLGVALGAVVFRITLFGLTPTLSDDIHRYLWDGRVQHAGINPYQYAPDDEALRWLRDDSWRLINHKDIRTIYPPLTQLAFQLGAWLSPTLTMQKAIFLACDLAVVALLVMLLPQWGLNPLMSLVYAWHPLVIVEVAASGHNDPLGVVWLMIGLALWHRRSRAIGTMAFGMAFLAKLTTALLWPFYWVRARRLLLAFAAMIAIGGLSCWCSPHFTPGLGQYSTHWEFNSSLYQILESWSGSPLLIRLLCGLILVVAGWALARRSNDLPWYTLRMTQLAILLTPVLEPWYLLWLIPLLCLRLSWVWLVFSGLVMLSYLVLVGFVREGMWQIPTWVKWVEYLPLYMWLLVGAWRRLIQKSEIRRQKSDLAFSDF